MKRYLVIIFIILTLSIPALAQEYTLIDLYKIAETESAQVSARLTELNNLRTDLEILQTNYRPKLSVSGKPLQMSPDLKNDETDFDANAALTGSLQLPLGLSLTTNLNLLNLYDSETRDFNYSLSLKYNIYPGQKTDSLLLQRESKERALQKSLWNLTTARLEVERQLTKKFYTTLILQEKLELSRASQNEAEADLTLYRGLQKRGDVSQRDVLEKEIAYQSSQISFERSQQQYQNSLKDLLVYAGISLTNLTEISEIKLIGSLDSIANLTLVTPEQLPTAAELHSEARANSTAYKTALMDLQVAEEELERMKNFPDIQSQFQYTPVPNSKDDEYNWTLTLSASYTISDGGRLKLEQSKQQRTIAELSEKVANTELEILDGLETRLTNLRIAYLEYLNTLLDLEKNRLDQHTKEEQLRKGLITQIQCDAGRRLVQSKELDLLQKKLDYQLTYWDFAQFVYSQSILSEVVQ